MSEAVVKDTENDVEYALRFHSRFDPGRGFAFPCDVAGNVDLDQLEHHALTVTTISLRERLWAESSSVQRWSKHCDEPAVSGWLK